LERSRRRATENLAHRLPARAEHDRRATPALEGNALLGVFADFSQGRDPRGVAMAPTLRRIWRDDS
jgi:hypothetical protein